MVANIFQINNISNHSEVNMLKYVYGEQERELIRLQINFAFTDTEKVSVS